MRKERARMGQPRRSFDGKSLSKSKLKAMDRGVRSTRQRRDRRREPSPRAFVVPTSRKGREKWGTPSRDGAGSQKQRQKRRSVRSTRTPLARANSRFLHSAVAFAPAPGGLPGSWGRKVPHDGNRSLSLLSGHWGLIRQESKGASQCHGDDKLVCALMSPEWRWRLPPDLPSRFFIGSQPIQ